MGRRVRIGSAFAAATLAFVVVGTSTAHAILSQVAYKCQTAIAKESAKYFNGKLKLIQKCKNVNIAAPGACLAPDATKLQKLTQKLKDGLDKKCALDGNSADALARIGFPGPCTDPNPGDGFTVEDLKACMFFAHDKALEGQCGGGTNHGQACTMLSDCPDTSSGTWCRGLTGIEYDPTVTTASGTALKCQEEVAKDTGKFIKTLLKSVQKCRNDLLNCKIVTKFGEEDKTVCKLTGLTPQSCATLNPKTQESVDKAKAKALSGIEAKCAADAGTLALCEPNQPDATTGATCEVQTHQDFADNPDASAIPDLLDYEYAQPGVCGDNVKNQTSEECDGVDDSACPGQCGAFDGNFPCLCQTVKRTRG